MSENSIILNIANTYGPILVGTQVSSALWGISCMQLFLYFFNYPNDFLGLKVFVAFMWLAGTGSQIMILMSPWRVLILRWGSVLELGHPSKLLVDHIPVAGGIAMFVQAFYLYHILLLGGRKWRSTVAFLALVCVFSFVSTIPLTVWDNQATSLAELTSERIVALEGACRACPAIVDIIIAISMVNLLTRGQQMGTKRTKGVLFCITIHCGVWTGVVALTDFILAAALPSTNLTYVVFESCVATLHVNSLLANLNSREYVRGSAFQFNSYHGSDGGIALHNLLSARSNAAKAVNTESPGITVRVDTDTAARTDSLRDDTSKAALTSSREEVLDV